MESIRLTFVSKSNVASHLCKRGTRSHHPMLKQLLRISERLEKGWAENGRRTKDDRRNVIVAKDRVYEADLLLF